MITSPSQVLNEANVPLERRIPSRVRELKAVVILRPDRPIWHHKRLAELLRQAGLHDIQTTAITQRTTYESHVALWSNADLVITDDHDALSGQALMHPGTGIIEIFPPLLNDDPHRQIASRTGVHYYGLTSNGLVPEDIVQAEEPIGMETLRHAQAVANVTCAKRCQMDTSCQFAMNALGAFVEDGPFWNAIVSILRKMVPSHHCGHHRLSGANL